MSVDLSYDKLKPPLSLYDLCRNKVALSLWNWARTFVKVQRKASFKAPASVNLGYFIESQLVSKLELTAAPKKDLVIAVHRIGADICLWISSLENQKDLEEHPKIRCFYQRIRWTPHGTIDHVETARRLATNRHLDIVFRYRLSCLFSQEDLITSIWSRMDRQSRMKVIERLNCKSERLASFWSVYIDRSLGKLLKYNYFRSFGWAFYISDCVNNEISAAFFWEKLTDTEKAENLQVRLISCPCLSAFLIAKLNRESLEVLLHKKCFETLKPLLDSGHFEAFDRELERNWDLLKRFSFDDLIEELSMKAIWLVRKYWEKAPVDYHRLFWLGRPFPALKFLFMAGDLSTLAILFKDRLVHWVHPFEDIAREMGFTFRHLIHVGNWKMLKFFGEKLIVTHRVLEDFQGRMTNVEYLLSDIDEADETTRFNVREWCIDVCPKFFRYISTLLEISPRYGYRLGFFLLN